MKLIVVGATGFVGGEVVRQALRIPQFSSVVALSRRAIDPAPAEQGSATFKNVIVRDYDKYSEDVKKELAGAAACVWTVAITPSAVKDTPFAEVKRVCQDSTLVGLKAIHDAGPAKPFHLIYMSGAVAERDQTKTPKAFPEYSLMRGETENQVLAYASANDMEACVVKPGLIYADWKPLQNPEVAKWIGSIDVAEVAVAMLRQIIHGIEKEPLTNDDLVRIGRDALAQN